MRIGFERHLRRIWSGHRAQPLTFGERLLYCLFTPLAILYASFAWGRRWFFHLGLFRRRRLSEVTVISIGNITVGGTGKSPLVVGLAKGLLEMDVKVAVVSRGYGALGRGSGPMLVSDGSGPLVEAGDAGDEPVMIAGAVAVPVIVSRDRYTGARLARDNYGARVVILDDGFQHLGLARDANIVLLDAADPFGNGWTLPAGRLREPLSALRDADLFLFVHRGPEGVQPIPDRLKGLLKAFRREAEIVSGTLRIQLVRRVGGEAIESPDWLSGRRLLLVSGLADPGPFEAEVEQRGGRIVEHMAFGDHHRYGEEEVEIIRSTFESGEAEAVLTTAKDEVKLVPAGLAGVVDELWVAESGFDPRTIDLLTGALS